MPKINSAYKLNRKKIVLPLQFVKERDKEKVLEENGIKLDRNTKCSICGELITLKNLCAIRQSKSGLSFICSKKSCINASLIVRSYKS